VTGSSAAESDRWSRWLLERRDAGSAKQREATLTRLAAVRDRVLAGAGPLEGATLLDVGAGDGLIGLEALERVGPDGVVIFSDVSEPLLEHCRRAVAERGLLERARFVCAGAEQLTGIPDASVDVITTRSVLIFVDDKPSAIAAFRRVLRPGGRVSLFEPINRLMFPESPDRFWGHDVSRVRELAARVKARFGAGEPAMVDFDDRDLVRLAVDAGFDRVHLECHIDVGPGSVMSSVSFDALLDGAPNPNAPTVREAVEASLSEEESAVFLAELERAFTSGRSLQRMAAAYLVARVAG